MSRWPQVPLGDLVTVVGGGTPARGNAAYWGGGIPWASVKDLIGPSLSTTQESVTRDGIEQSATTVVPPGSIIVATRMGLGKVAMNTVPIAINQDLKALICSPRVASRYLLHFLVARSQQFVALGNGATVKGITLDQLSSFRVQLPPLAEQRRIAAFLDKADGIRRRRRDGARLVDELLKASFLQMFGDPTHPTTTKWVRNPLADVASIDRGRFTPRPRNDPRYYGGQLPFIQTGDLSRAGGRLQNWSQTLNDDGAKVSRRFAAGTVAISIAANIGDTAIVDFDFYCPDSVVVVVPRPAQLNAEFLEMCLRFYKPALLASAPKTAQRNINLAALRPLRIPVPPLDAQEAFAAIRERTEKLAMQVLAVSHAAQRMTAALCHVFLNAKA